MMKRCNSERQLMTMYETKLTDKQERNEKSQKVTNHTVTISPYHISVVPLTAINYIGSIQTNILVEIEENPFLPI